MVTEAGLLRAAAAAASLDDRRGAGLASSGTSPAAVAARLAAWRGYAAGGDRAAFRAYLAEAGISTSEAARLMHDVAAPAASAAPAWVQTLDRIAVRTRHGDGAGDPGAAPFGQLLSAAAAVAGDAISRALPAGPRTLLTPGAQDGLATALITDLSELAAPALYEAFAESRRRLREQGRADSAYDRFVDGQRAAGLPLLVTTYPVLGRLAAQRVTETACAVSELLGRLHADLPALRDAFWAGTSPGPVTGLELGWSDRHQDGRTVARVVFAGGQVIAYKPRPVDAERALHELAGSLRQAGLAAPLAPRTLARAGYGWADWVTQRPSATAAGLAEYYRRAGTLLALTSLLQGTDLLLDNIVAAGDGPAVVDAEMLAPPRLAARPLPADGTDLPADAAVLGLLQESVVDTGLLPWWVGTSPAQVRDICGLTGRHLAYGTCWSGLNTASMIPVAGPRAAPRTRNTPAGGDPAGDAAAHLPDLIDGYRRAHRWLGQHPARTGALVRQSGLLTAPARFTFRATAAYVLLARRATAPAMLADGLARSLALDAVNNPVTWTGKLASVHAEDPAAARAITAAERRSLERLDIPLFMASPVQRDLPAGPGTVRGVLRGQPDADLADRLASMDAAHREQQVLCIRGCFEGRFTGARPFGARERQAAPMPPPAAAMPVPATVLAAAARRIADLAAARAVRADGSVSWLVVAENHAIGRHQLRPIGSDLYSGRAGLGLFLAAAARCRDDPALAELARGCLAPVASAAAQAGQASPGGGLTGAASAIYGLAVAAELLADRPLAASARQAAAGLAASLASGGAAGIGSAGGAGVPAGDVASGLLGAGLALAAAARHGAGDAAASAAACLAGRVLAALGDGPVTGLLAAGPAGQPDPGMAHGLLGAALALSRIHALTGADRLAGTAAAMTAAAAEMLGSTGPAATGGSWCRGWAGIAAAALALGDGCQSPPWQAWTAAALARARQPSPAAGVSACCGQAGAAELLLLAGEVAAARTAAATMIPAPGADWRVGVLPGAAPLLLGFHRGLAGVGYTFLRAVSPDSVPSVLIWR
jgi:class II lanthipeptide synthase